MKAHYFCKNYLSNALRRVEQGLMLTAPPNIEWVSSADEADIIFLPVISAKDIDIPYAVKYLHKTVIMQLCYLSAGGTVNFWKKVWKEARLTVSYYTLPTKNYLKLPLGYDPALFYKDDSVEKIYDVLVTGFVDGTKSRNGEVILDLVEFFDDVCHIGHNFGLGRGYHSFTNIHDAHMRLLYQQSRYVVGLRFVEGFELPIVEGAACGAIPITFDMECYHWFRDIALYINPSSYIEDLAVIADYNYDEIKKPLKEDVEKFTWYNTIGELWKNV